MTILIKIELNLIEFIVNAAHLSFSHSFVHSSFTLPITLTWQGFYNKHLGKSKEINYAPHNQPSNKRASSSHTTSNKLKLENFNKNMKIIDKIDGET